MTGSLVRAHGQRGVVLLVSLVMLLLVSLMVLSGFNLTQTNLKVVHNLESREQAREAASAALEEAISSNLFLSTKGETLFSASCEQANRKCYDLNGDGASDVNVDVALSCTITKQLTNGDVQERAKGSAAQEDTDSPFDEWVSSPWITGGCIEKAETGGVIEADLNSMSRCSDVVWDFVATATDQQTGAVMTVRQGLATAADKNSVSDICD